MKLHLDQVFENGMSYLSISIQTNQLLYDMAVNLGYIVKSSLPNSGVDQTYSEQSWSWSW